MKTQGSRRGACTQQRAAGFTLVEVLVALAIMAVLAGLAWRGIDGMVRARDGSQQAVDRIARLNTILVQWAQDLDAIRDSQVVPPLKFDGQTLLLTRSLGDGIAVVAWSLRGGSWQRWVGPSVTHVGALQQNWLQAQQLLGNESGQLRLLENVSSWQLYFYRGNAWTNAQSSADVVQPAAAAASAAVPVVQQELLPDGIRLVLTLASGSITRDIQLAPH